MLAIERGNPVPDRLRRMRSRVRNDRIHRPIPDRPTDGRVETDDAVPTDIALSQPFEWVRLRLDLDGLLHSFPMPGKQASERVVRATVIGADLHDARRSPLEQIHGKLGESAETGSCLAKIDGRIADQGLGGKPDAQRPLDLAYHAGSPCERAGTAIRGRVPAHRRTRSGPLSSKARSVGSIRPGAETI